MRKRKLLQLGLGTGLFLGCFMHNEAFLSPFSTFNYRISFRKTESLPSFVRSSRPSVPSGTTNATSLQDLLRELDSRNIRYSPTASRQELEQLLKESSSIPNEEVISIPSLLQELDDRAIRYPPTASRQDLIELLNKTKQKPQTSSFESKEQSIGALLQELDHRGIRYAPTASRAELEQLLIKHDKEKNDSISKDAAQHDPNSKQGILTSTPNSASSYGVRLDSMETKQDSAKLSLTELLQELDYHNIRYSPTALRPELELLLQKHSEARRSESKEATTDSSGKEDIHRERLQRRARRRRQQEEEMPSWQRVLQKNKVIPQVGSTTSRTVERAARNARRVSRKAIDLFKVDEDGIRDADYQYVYRDAKAKPIDVPFRRVDLSSTANKVPRRRRSSRPPSARAARTRPSTSSIPKRPNPPHRQTASTQPLLPAVEMNETARNSPQGRRDSTPKRKEFDRSSTSSKRRIYSPYKSQDDDKDAVDRFGEFLADTADKVMWGKYDEMIDTKNEPEGGSSSSEKYETGAKSTTSADGAQRARSASNRQPRHWKDRLEERLDYLLGIHRDGEYYRSWMEREEDERRNEGGYDVFSVAQGRRPKRRHKPANVKHDKPFWEEEGNLISLLFGRTHSGGSLFFERVLDGNNGSLVNLFRTVLRSILMLASYLCRWASVRGALPQPVVVVGVLSAGITARPRRRLRAMVIAFIALRTVAELLHGSIYGDEDWEEDNPEYQEGDEWEGDGL